MHVPSLIRSLAILRTFINESSVLAKGMFTRTVYSWKTVSDAIIEFIGMLYEI